jgi:hypothetical protein
MRQKRSELQDARLGTLSREYSHLACNAGALMIAGLGSMQQNGCASP